MTAAVCLVALLLAAAEEPITVTLDRPDPFAPAFGEVEIVAVVSAEEPIERVVFAVDGVLVGERREAPYTLTAELGDDVRRHVFEVVAYAASGRTGLGSLVTPGLEIHEEVDVNLQQLYVTATRDGGRVLDLSAEDFEIYDDKARQTLVTFARGDIPFTAAVMLDSSVSMQGAKLAAALAGARTFFEQMRPLDQSKLLVFSDRVLHMTPFTSFPAVLTAGLGQVRATGGTALNDTLYLALKELETRQGRRVVVLLSDGVDSHSVLSMAEVLAHARRSQALIYWLRLPYGDGAPSEELPRLSTAWRSPEDYQREIELLRRTVEESGGRVHLLAGLEDIAPAFEDIVAELREQYALGYYPLRVRHDGRWHRVKVEVSLRGLEIRCREGYLDL